MWVLAIRPCREQDLVLLRSHIPTFGRPERHTTRFERQRHGESTLLVAWIDGLPVGAGEIRWRGCAAPEINQRYPHCPELSGLDVWPPERRSQGIGTALVRAAEDLTRQRGYAQLGLGVEDTNHRAAALYLRLGYQETDSHYLDRHEHTDENGTRHAVADPARFLVKNLAPQAS